MGTARISPVEDVLTGIVASLKAASGVTAIVSTRIYNNVPQGTAYPYVEVSSPTDRREDTMSRFGALTLVDVKAVSQWFGDREAARIIDACVTALNNTLPSMTSHVALGIAWESNERLREVINGVVTRTHVATFRVWTEQAT